MDHVYLRHPSGDCRPSLSAEYRSTYRCIHRRCLDIGRYSAHLSTEYRPIVTDDIGRPSVGRHIDQHVDRDSADMSPTLGLHVAAGMLTDTRPTYRPISHRHSADTLPLLDRLLLLCFIFSLSSNVSCLRCPRSYF